MSKQNLMSDYSKPYIHSYPYHIAEVASSVDVGGKSGKNPYSKNIGVLRNLQEQAKQRENAFFSQFDEDCRDAVSWSRRYLANSGGNSNEGNDFAKKVAAAFASRSVKDALEGRLSSNEIVNNIEIALKEDYQNISNDFAKIASEDAMEKEKVEKLREIFTQNIVNLETSDQNKIRKEINTELFAKGKTKRLKSEKGIANKMFNYLSKSDKRDKKYMNTVKTAFLQELSQISGLSIQELENPKGKYYNYIKPYYTALNKAQKGQEDYYKDLFSNNANIQTGAVGEVGSFILLQQTLELDFKEKKKNTSVDLKLTGGDKVNRFDLKETVESKTDLMMSLKQDKKTSNYRFQVKNTTKDIFSDLENFGKQQEISIKKVFFKGASKVKLSTLLDEIQKIGTSTGQQVFKTNDFGVLSYLICNLAALNFDYAGKNQGNTRNKVYQKETEGRKGLLLPKTRDIISKMLSQYLILYIADFSNNNPSAKELFAPIPYDFIIFNNRLLLPVTELYECIINSLQHYDEDLNNQLASIHADYFTKSFSWKNMYDQKLRAVGSHGFDASLDYQDADLVNAGKDAGQEVYDNLFIRNININFDISKYFSENLVNWSES